MFVSRFSRAEHVDTLVSWIEAQNQCLQKFALLSSQGLPPAILTSLETKLRFALAFWLFPPAPKIFSGPTFHAALQKKKCCLCGKAVLRAYAVLKIVISVFRWMLLLTVLPKKKFDSLRTETADDQNAGASARCCCLYLMPFFDSKDWWPAYAGRCNLAIASFPSSPFGGIL